MSLIMNSPVSYMDNDPWRDMERQIRVRNRVLDFIEINEVQDPKDDDSEFDIDSEPIII